MIHYFFLSLFIFLWSLLQIKMYDHFVLVYTKSHRAKVKVYLRYRCWLDSLTKPFIPALCCIGLLKPWQHMKYLLVEFNWLKPQSAENQQHRSADHSLYTKQKILELTIQAFTWRICKRIFSSCCTTTVFPHLLTSTLTPVYEIQDLLYNSMSCLPLHFYWACPV